MIAVIGAGMAGLTCARALSAAGHGVTVFDKGRGVGGRLATRRVEIDGETLSFDHGAQYVTARDPAFQTFIGEAVRAGKAGLWQPETSHGGATGRRSDWWVGAPSMSALVKTPALQALHPRTGEKVVRISGSARAWMLTLDSGHTHGPFSAVVVTAPAPQAADLLPETAASGRQALAAVRYGPCWTAMAAFATALPGADLYRDNTADLAWTARNGTKPGRGGPHDCWTLQASPDWSRTHLEEDGETVAGRLLALFAEKAGAPLPTPVHLSAHRWRYARVETPLGASHWEDGALGLYAGGDWALGARVECAHDSGLAIAESIVRTQAPTLAPTLVAHRQAG